MATPRPLGSLVGSPDAAAGHARWSLALAPSVATPQARIQPLWSGTCDRWLRTPLSDD